MPEEHLGRNACAVAVGEASAGPAAEVRASALGSTVRALVVGVAEFGVVAVVEARYWCCCWLGCASFA